MVDTFAKYPDDDFSVVPEKTEGSGWQESSASDEAFYSSALSESEDPISSYLQTKEELLRLGSSEESSDVRDAYRLEQENLVADNLSLLIQDPDVSVEEKQNTIRIMMERQAASIVDLRQEYMTEKAVSQDFVAETPEAANRANTFLEDLDTAIADESIIAEQVAKEMGKDWGWGDFALSIVPLNASLSYREFGEKVLGSESPLFPGEIIKAYRTKLEEKRKIGGHELRTFMDSTMKAVNGSAGIMDNNTAIRSQMLHTLFSEYQGTYKAEEDFDWDRWLENSVAVLDAIAIGQVARVAARGVIGYTKGTKLSALNKADQKGTQEVTVAAIADDTDQLAKELGVTKEELVQVVLPKPDIEGTNAVAAKGGTVLEKSLNAQTDEILAQTQAIPSNFTRAQREGVKVKLEKDLNAVRGATYYEGMSTIAKTENGYVYKATYGLDDGGFLSAKDAMARAKELFPEETPITLLRRNPTTGAIGKVTGVGEQSGEYFFQALDMRRFVTGSIPDDLLFFPPGAVYHGSYAARNFFTAPTARFAEYISRGGIRAHQLGKVVEKRLLDMIDVPFIKLPKTDKLKVTDRLQRASDEGEWYTRETLVGEGWTQKQADGAIAVKQMMNTVYMLNNRKLRDKLVASKQSYITGHGYETVGKPITVREAMQTASAYDPELGKIIHLSPSQINTLYEDGNTLARMVGRQVDGNDITDYVLVKNGSSVKKLPNTVLNYIPGYSTVRYKEHYFVTKTTTNSTVNGVKNQEITGAIRAVPSKTEAAALAEREMARGEEGVTYSWKRGRELEANNRLEQAEWEINASSGKLFFNKRGERLKGIDDDFAHVEDPIDSMLRTVSTVARQVTQDDWIVAMRKQYLSTFGKFSNNKYPADVNNIASPSGAATTAEVGKARALFEYIEHMDGVQDKVASNWKAMMLNTGEWIEGTTNNRVRQLAGRATIALGDNDPLKVSRGLTYNLFIAGNPFRQLLLQSQQILFVAALNPKFAFHPKGMINQSFAITAGYFARTRPEVWAKVAPAAAKQMGVSVPEYKKILKAFFDSGLTQEIESHTLARDGLIKLSEHVSKTASGRAATTMKNVLTSPIRAARFLGFDAGEYMNRINTWTMVRDDWIKKNPGRKWDSKIALNKIATDTENLVLSMSRADQFGYQKGVLSALTQFFSIQHKALAAMLPNKFGGNKLLSAQQKRRIALAQAAQWGTAGLGIQKIYEETRDSLGIQLPEAADKILVGGMNEYLINSMIAAASPESDDLDLAGSLAPASGILLNPMEIFLDVITGEEMLQEVMLGASGNAWGRIGSAVDMGIDLVGQRDLADPETSLLVLKEGASIFSGYSNYLKSNIMRSLEHHVAKNGTPLAQELLASNAEAYGQFMGFQTKEVQEYYDWVKDARKLQDSVKDDVTEIMNRLGRVAVVIADEQPTTISDAYAAKAHEVSSRIGAMLSHIDDRDYKHAVVLELQKRIRQDMNNPRSIYQQFGRLQSRGYMSMNGLEYSREKVKSLLTPTQLQDVDKLIDHMKEQ